MKPSTSLPGAVFNSADWLVVAGFVAVMLAIIV